jgi:hypothetical protein
MEWLEIGNPIEITKRGRLFARLYSIKAPLTATAVKIDFGAQLRAVWGKKRFSDLQVRKMRADELGGLS